MLDMSFDFKFPHLAYYKSASLVRSEQSHNKSSKSGRPIQLFKLDWGTFELAPILPKQYDEVISNLVFSLDEKYLHEIHHSTRMAFIERSRHRGFDTAIRDICLAPVDTYIYVAFRLICDCVFDEEKKYWREHDWVRTIAHHAMLLKFWHRQTGAGLLWEKAQMDRLLQHSDEKVQLFYKDMLLHSDEMIAPATAALIIDLCGQVPKTTSNRKANKNAKNTDS